MKLNEGLKEYNEKVKSGEISPTKPLDPIEKAKQNPRSLRAAINAKCFDCCCYQKYEIKVCPAKDCPLYLVRPYQEK